jgi:citrate/tricarballylate utilization protein
LPGLLELVEEAGRQLTICNACRYCEGYCAVFPAAERRSIFTEGDVVYLANLCHDCRACYQACMYAPPHEFGVNVPAVLTEARVQTYRRYAWPRRVAEAFRRDRVVAAALTGVGLVLALLAVWASGRWGGLLRSHPGPGAFYEVIPYLLLTVAALAGAAFVVAVVWGGMVRFWRKAGGGTRELLDWRSWWDATRQAAVLRNLSGGGDDCYYPDRDRPSGARRIYHSLVFYGFIGAFVSTTLAFVWQHFLGQLPPYPVLSPPVLFGMTGGAGLIAGCTGLIWLKLRADRALGSEEMRGMDMAFLVVLDLVSITGVLTLVLRETPALGPALVVHLALLVALCVAAPYGKFVHFVYRYAALVLDSAEKRRTR